MDELTSVYVQESREQLAEMEAGLLRLEQTPDDRDTINAVFRAAHTIKGGSGVIECHFIEHFTHLVENLLDALRNDEIELSSAITTLLLECCDHMGHLVDTLAAGTPEPDPTLCADGEALTGRLKDIIAAEPGRGGSSSLTVTDDTVEVENLGNGVVNTDSWHISVRFGRNVMRGGMDPLSFLRYLGNLGEIIGTETITDAMPAAADMDPESCYMGFEIRLQTRASKSEIERVFDFVRDDCDLRILPPQSTVTDYIRLINELPEDNLRLGEMLVRCGALTQAEVDAGLKAQHAAEDTPAAEATAPPLGEILVESRMVHKEIVDAAVNRQTQIVDKKAREAQLVRVHADKLDQLIDLVGELVIAGASANLLALKSNQSDLVEATSILSRLVESIRDSALQLRMVQIGDTFNRFNRVVRDVSKELGKEIELSISGADTELDKTVVEKIGDPLMHLVRNSLDHGIEPVAVRLERGKRACGRVSLNAYHDSGIIVIQVSDDGGGLNREKIRAKAIERELIQPGDNLGDKEIINLIFEPGFSTVDKVSNLSGRGVGMDVVRRNILALRGTVDVESVEGQGSTFTIRLPLTLAIIDGFLVGIEKAAYVIPLDSVVECIEQKNLTGDRNFLNLRGEALPFIRLRDIFEIPGEAPARESIVVVQSNGRRAGIVVDHLMGEFQTVIKPLGRMFAHLRGIGGSTILGSGEVALILDVGALVNLVTRAEEERLLPHRHTLALASSSTNSTAIPSGR
ncbi:chemotaxis protein CheA [Propionivibrio dicarboxylicus]|uniref:Chemotaxis protein CheA n=1 Tax=Propionivibrio dicarboxylicus TaxID=83767 RepID=A0A1G8KQH2_9RHOO|nr:chemotaxis protein CheA [Propionivibrio dicarboxylicus]SDI45678.1 two-component system, chemotaxis family, sensor kinase CheA [Propionivibrio dicarboxylicus]